MITVHKHRERKQTTTVDMRLIDETPPYEENEIDALEEAPCARLCEPTKVAPSSSRLEQPVANEVALGSVDPERQLALISAWDGLSQDEQDDLIQRTEAGQDERDARVIQKSLAQTIAILGGAALLGTALGAMGSTDSLQGDVLRFVDAVISGIFFLSPPAAVVLGIGYAAYKITEAPKPRRNTSSGRHLDPERQ